MWLWLACGAPADAPAVAPIPPAAAPPRLVLPVAGKLGEDLWITSRPDVDLGPGIRDHAGSDHTYDGHDGTDVALAYASDRAWVVAPAAGRVLRARDGRPDGQLTAGGEAAVDGEECANGLVLDVGGDWTVQLCHFAWGTLQVQPGAQVAVGERLGRVGWSGEADHAHVHVTVRKADRVVDPFSGRFLDDGAVAAPLPLWDVPPPAAMDALVWAGFDAGPEVIGDGWPLDGPRAEIPPWAPSLVLRVFLWRPQEGDVVRTAITNPAGVTTRAEWVQPRTRPREVVRIEKTWPADARAAGLWTAIVSWERGAGRHRELRTTTVVQGPRAVP